MSYDDNDLGSLDRLEDMLNAYCEARLMPQGAVLSRVRANILARHAAAAAMAAAERRLTAEASAPKRRLVTVQSALARRAFTLGFAASLTLGTTAAVMAAPPGSPFYNARVYLEALVLPSQPDDRLAAHERLLEDRIHEAEIAAARNDTMALAAALVAYRSEVDAATADVGDDPTRLARLEEVLAKHTAVLTALAGRLPEQASIEHAIQASSNAITKLKAREHPAHPAHPPQGGPGNGPGSNSGSGQTGSGGQGVQGSDQGGGQSSDPAGGGGQDNQE